MLGSERRVGGRSERKDRYRIIDVQHCCSPAGAEREQATEKEDDVGGSTACAGG